ncbi:hypothetical protein SAMN05216311_103371 [Chitinophaga sp. CF418]|nr:hypothetical protein SAMN05216311_103371 [Chitinophaga sp. CF418]
MITCAAVTAFRCTPACSIYGIVFLFTLSVDYNDIVNMAYFQVEEL